MTAQVIQFGAKAHQRKVHKAPSVDSIGRLKRPTNAEVRPREYLTPAEVDDLINAAKKRGRYGQRDALLVLMMARHGLRVSELVELEWGDIDLKAGTVYVARKKRGRDSTHPLNGVELRQLRQLKREWEASRFVFCSERGGPMTDGNVRKLITAIGVEAGLPFPIHPHMLRHACGYKYANEGKDTRSLQHYLGHVNIQHTVRYTDISPVRFKGW